MNILQFLDAKKLAATLEYRFAFSEFSQIEFNLENLNQIPKLINKTNSKNKFNKTKLVNELKQIFFFRSEHV